MDEQGRALRDDGQRREVHGLSGRVRARARGAEPCERSDEGRDERDIRGAALARIDDIKGPEAEIAAHGVV